MQLVEESLEERVYDAADVSHYLTGSDIQIDTASSRVILRGVVASYYEKQMAQETLLRVDGVESVENHLEVMRRRSR